MRRAMLPSPQETNAALTDRRDWRAGRCDFVDGPPSQDQFQVVGSSVVHGSLGYENSQSSYQDYASPLSTLPPSSRSVKDVETRHVCLPKNGQGMVTSKATGASSFNEPNAPYQDLPAVLCINDDTGTPRGTLPTPTTTYPQCEPVYHPSTPDLEPRPLGPNIEFVGSPDALSDLVIDAHLHAMLLETGKNK